MTDRAGDIALLLKKHIQGELNDDEQVQLMNWKAESIENRKVFDELVDETSLQEALRDLYFFSQTLDENKRPPVVDIKTARTNLFKYIAVAAVLMGLVGMIWLHLVNRQGKQTTAKTDTKKAIQDIAPGGDKAILTLADGSTIVLDNADNGVVAEQGKTTIRKMESGKLEYKATTHQTPLIVDYNTITTPRGGQYQLTLPDGSKVWLNAASSLKFPVSFNGNKRTVQLTGEAYFEVAHVTLPGRSERVPFEVQVNNGMKVDVLGTHFNVMAYEDELEAKTTLLEGKVKVLNNQGQTATLQPGQQALLSNADDKMQVKNDADIAVAVAWKNGLFKFEHTDLKTVMR